MNNFYAYNPTKILFGIDMCSRMGAELSDTRKIMLLTGQGSARKSGAYDQVVQAINTTGIPYVHVEGIEPNPDYDTCIKAIDTARSENVDFILAVGGGSVIDAAKFIALSIHCPDDPWDVITRKKPMPAKVLPIGCVLTLPASGSEMNNAIVISRRTSGQKIAFNAHTLYPRFSVLDPSFTLTLSQEQTALGITDMFVHTLEQYITYPVASAALQDRQAEALLLTLIDTAPRLLEDPQNVDLRANIMWCGTQAINGTISRGVPVDWSTHVIGHELTALYDIPHARTLTLILSGLYRHQMSHKMQKLAQYGRRVFGLNGSDQDVAASAITKTESFFQSLGMPIRFSEIGLNANDVAAAVRSKLDVPGFVALGEHKAITLDDVDVLIKAQA